MMQEKNAIALTVLRYMVDKLPGNGKVKDVGESLIKSVKGGTMSSDNAFYLLSEWTSRYGADITWSEIIRILIENEQDGLYEVY